MRESPIKFVKNKFMKMNGQLMGGVVYVCVFLVIYMFNLL